MRQKTLKIMLAMLMSMVASLVCADEHEYVDLGLPSGTLWATCNIGANSPEECGDYFAWGETTTKSTYDWSTYQWCNGSGQSLTKYCNNNTSGYNGFTDTLIELELEDDAAYVNWGEAWRTPTQEQLNELKLECTWVWTTKNGMDGYQINGKDGSSIFIPKSGYRWGGSYYSPSIGYCWSSTLWDEPAGAWLFDFNKNRVYISSFERCGGNCVRPVRPKIPATGIVLNYDSYTIEGVGKNLQLEVAVQPENTTDKGITVTWKSFNESVCFVTNGHVVSTGYGTTLVMATTTDNRFMAYCAITVTDETPVTDIEADKTDGAVYDLSGREITKPTRGIYIKDGKKMIAK